MFVVPLPSAGWHWTKAFYTNRICVAGHSMKGCTTLVYLLRHDISSICGVLCVRFLRDGEYIVICVRSILSVLNEAWNSFPSKSGLLNHMTYWSWKTLCYLYTLKIWTMNKQCLFWLFCYVLNHGICSDPSAALYWTVLTTDLYWNRWRHRTKLVLTVNNAVDFDALLLGMLLVGWGEVQNKVAWFIPFSYELTLFHKHWYVGTILGPFSKYSIIDLYTFFSNIHRFKDVFLLVALRCGIQLFDVLFDVSFCKR